MYEFFEGAFEGYDGSILIGNSRMLVKEDGKIAPFMKIGVTELPQIFKDCCPQARMAGVAIGGDTHTVEQGIPVISYEEYNTWDESGDGPPIDHISKGIITTLNPDLDHYMFVDESGYQEEECYDAEVFEGMDLALSLEVTDARVPVLVTWNGGGGTRRAVNRALENGIPVILIEGSGRETDVMCDELADNPNVHIVNRDAPMDLRIKLFELGAIAA